MVAGTSYTSSRRYARKSGNPRKKFKRRVRRSRRGKKGKVATTLSKSLLKKLDNRYVEESEAETKLSPIYNYTDYIQLNTFGNNPVGSGPSLTFNGSYANLNGFAPVAPCTLCDPAGAGAWSITGNVFQMGRNLSNDLEAYNNTFLATTPQSPCFPLRGLEWYNPVQASTPIPIGTNPTRVMDGQYLNLRRTTVNFSVNMNTVDTTQGRSYNRPCQFRVMHITSKRDNSPSGTTYSPLNHLWLDESGQAKGLNQLYDQTLTTLGRISKQQAMKYPINRQYFRVHSDFGFTLQNPLLPDGFDSGPTITQNTTFSQGNYTYPAEKQFTITRNWGKQNKTLFRPDPLVGTTEGIYIPQDENYKDYIIIIAVRGLCTVSSQGGFLNCPDFGRGKGYTISCFGSTSAKDL